MHEATHHICDLELDCMHSRFDSVAKQMENKINNVYGDIINLNMKVSLLLACCCSSD